MEPSAPKRAAGARRVARRSTKAVTQRVDRFMSARGPRFRALAMTHAFNAAGDTLVAVALADVLFLQPDANEARGNVVLYLAVTLAPFAVIGPFLGGLFARFPVAYRRGLGAASAGRAMTPSAASGCWPCRSSGTADIAMGLGCAPSVATAGSTLVVVVHSFPLAFPEELFRALPCAL